MAMRQILGILSSLPLYVRTGNGDQDDHVGRQIRAAENRVVLTQADAGG